MSYLLDTHTFLWWAAAPEKLGKKAFAIIENQKNTIYLSVASAWEISIKYSIGKLPLTVHPEKIIADEVQANQFRVLPIEMVHAINTSALPYHHRDPFDRLLVSQSAIENFTLVTNDPLFADYEISTTW